MDILFFGMFEREHKEPVGSLLKLSIWGVDHDTNTESPTRGKRGREGCVVG